MFTAIESGDSQREKQSPRHADSLSSEAVSSFSQGNGDWQAAKSAGGGTANLHSLLLIDSGSDQSPPGKPIDPNPIDRKGNHIIEREPGKHEADSTATATATNRRGTPIDNPSSPSPNPIQPIKPEQPVEHPVPVRPTGLAAPPGEGVQ